MSSARERVPVLQLAPWVDFGGSDRGTLDWFRWLDRERFALSLLTTQPSPNRRLREVVPFAEEVWALPELMSGDAIARFVLGFIVSRGVRVVHVMNSRLGFELLADIHALPNRPRVVVQLHVEEPGRDGYVRYVGTRFGNLVDGFSVSTPGLADSLLEYGVTRDRIRVILTGIDAEDELSPERVPPLGGLEPHLRHILFPARLVPQKDPLLMVEVVDALRLSHRNFVLHVVGEGELEDAVREAIAERRLERWIRLHPASTGLAHWYAACDALLMTSEFEGVPYVLYEAMAMGLPTVVPALPGILAIVDEQTSAIVTRREDAERYATALAGLLDDPYGTAKMAARARALVRERYPVRGMADAHAELYEELLRAAPAPPPSRPPPPLPAPLRLRARPARGTPMVSVIIPCFNQGAWLLECLASLRAQTYPELELIVIDDASTDPDTVAALAQLKRAGGVRVLRQRRNKGPSAARNKGIKASQGRYVLPVDADNLLLPRAVAMLVSQLQCAGERVGYVYQSIQYFGNREDYFEAPEHNLHTLMGMNYCDTSALIDRAVFDAGMWFPEVVDGHEDWDYFIGLAEHGIEGEPARARTLLARKHGFTRSDRIDHTIAHPERLLASHHEALFARAQAIKAQCSPALTVIALAPVAAGSASALELPARLHGQSCHDFELLAVADRQFDVDVTPVVRWLPARLAAAPADLLQEGLRRARGRWVLITRGAPGEAFGNRALVEQLLRLLRPDDGPRAVVLADAGGHDLRPLGAEEVAGMVPHAVAWAVGTGLQRFDGLSMTEGDELEAIARALLMSGDRLEWRQLRAPLEAAAPATADGAETGDAEALAPAPPRALRLRIEDVMDGHARLERDLRLAGEPTLGAAPALPRLRADEPWRPVLTLPLCRHRAHDGEGRVLNTSAEPLPGHDLERVLGVVRSQSFVGTQRLALGTGGGPETHPRGQPLDAAELARTLGYVEDVHFNGLEALVRGRHAGTGQAVLVCGAEDPLWGALAEPGEVLGFIEGAPVNPRAASRGATWPRLLGLVRAADFEARRHRYALGEVPAGRCVWELGAALGDSVEDAIPFELIDGRIMFRGWHAPRRPAPVRTASWALAPLGWRDFGQSAARRRAVLRRLAATPGLIVRAPQPVIPRGRPHGWLLREGGPGRVPLYAAIHPATGDQLLTRYRIEASETGYGEPALLGYLIAQAPQTGSLSRPPTAIPWASRFGSAVRWELEPEGNA